tara:strand:+ start:6872 stop:7417 length:546 start_codon:yes stop_codon:yes gene_type:complete
MLGLGADILHASAPSVTQLKLSGFLFDGSVGSTFFVNETDDENVMVLFRTTDTATKAALLDGITQGTGKKVNGTFDLTVTNVTADPDKVGTKTFNIFQYLASSEEIYFLAPDTSNITISSGNDYQKVDLTVATFLDSGGSDAELDASGSGEIYNFTGVLNITGFDSSTNAGTSDNLSIDAA